MQVWRRALILVGLTAVLLGGAVSCSRDTSVADFEAVEHAILEVKKTPDPVGVGVSGFLRHHEDGFVNYGIDYIYGDLFMAYGCMRISYVGYDAPADARGFMVVWPASGGLVAVEEVVFVIDRNGEVLATSGESVRLSGRSSSARGEAWDWVSGDGAPCLGPYWIVGDEVSGEDALEVDASRPWVFFPRLKDVRGPKGYPEALLEGELLQSGRCLLVSADNLAGRYLVVWPPGFSAEQDDRGVSVLNGGGNVVARVGDHIALGGYSPDAVDYQGNEDCLGRYFYGYQVTPGQ